MTPQIIIAFTFGVVFVVALVVLAIVYPKPTPFQYQVFRIIISLAAAGVAAMIPGFINLEANQTAGLIIRAGGALAVFVIVYFFDPVKLAVDGSEGSSSAKPKEQVAAICYRLQDDDVQFLLVRTTGGRWTFPKGKVKSGEERWFAAKREAMEEAGAEGDIGHEPITSYLHEKKEWKGEGSEYVVHAFLMNVSKTRAPKEKRRKPTWFFTAKAEEALIEDREFKYAEEFRRVLNEAISRVTQAQGEG